MSFRALHSTAVIAYKQRRRSQGLCYEGAEKRASPRRVLAFQSDYFKQQHATFTSRENLNKLDYRRLPAEFRNVREFAEKLPIKTDDGAPISDALEFGLKHGKALILRYLSEMNNLLGDEKGLNLSDAKQGEKFKNKSLRVEKDFESLVGRL